MDSDRITWLRERLKQRFDVAEYNELRTLEAAEQSAAQQEAQQRQAQDDAKPAESAQPAQWTRPGRGAGQAP